MEPSTILLIICGGFVVVGLGIFIWAEFIV